MPSTKNQSEEKEVVPRRSLAQNITFRLVFALIVFLILESGFRIGIWMEYKVSFFKPGEVILTYYPEIQNFIHHPPSKAENEFNILFLSGSVGHPNNGHIAYEIERQFGPIMEKKGLELKLTNFSTPGHCSRDSRIKMELLDNFDFDLLILMHGINDARTNNSPPEIFKEDYSHYEFYNKVNHAFHHRDMWLSVIPFFIKDIWIRNKVRFNPENYAPEGRIESDWLAYGDSLKSARPMQENMRAILKLAEQRKVPAILSSFAWHIPEGYTKEKFEAQALGYNLESGRDRFPIETWGTPKNIKRTLATHNQMTRLLAKEEKCLFWDAEQSLAGNPSFFDDVCHLSDSGSAVLVNGWKPLLEQVVSQSSGNVNL